MRLDRRTLRGVGAVVVAVLVVLVWWFQDTGGGPSGDDSGPDERVAGMESTSSPSDGPTATESSPTESNSSDSSGSESSAPPSTLGIDPASGLHWVRVGDLPIEAAETLELIDAGGPFPYDRDGITFGNYEGILPPESRGYYREYTVPTPGSSDRGARRIVTGGADEFYWTADHYASFERIDR